MIRHLRLTFRVLAANRGFAVAAVLALALGIGPNTAIFSVVYANLLAPMPYPHPDQLVMIWSKDKGNRSQVAPADFLDWRRQASSFQQMAAFFDQGFNMSSGQEPMFVPGERVSTNWYKLLGEEVWLGRDFRADEDQPGKDHVFIPSHKCWASRFGSDRSIIGKQFRLNGEPYTAIGVMPPGPSDRHGEEIWVPLRFSRAELERGATFWFVLGRLRSGVSIQQAQQEMNAVTRRISELYPVTVRSFVNRIHVDLEVRTDHILTLHLPVPESRLAEPVQTDAFYRELLARLEAVPGVERAAATTSTPLQGTDFDLEVRVEGQQAANSPRLPEAGFQPVTPGYFQTFGVRLTAGRVLDARDSANSPRVAMVNEAFVRGFLKGHAPLSRRLFVEQLRNGVLATGPAVPWQVVGVFHDVQNNDRMGEPNHPEIYVPFAQSPWPQAMLAVRTALPPEKMMKAIAAVAHSLAPDVPLVDVQTMEQIAQSRFVDDRFGMALYGSMAGIALLLAALGIYGVMSFTVAQGTAEIGLRMALGASPEQVLLGVLKHGLAMAGAGLGLGLIGAYFIGRAMQSILFGTDSMDWSALGVVAALLLGAALLACYFPARRAGAVDPMVALRQG